MKRRSLGRLANASALPRCAPTSGVETVQGPHSPRSSSGSCDLLTSDIRRIKGIAIVAPVSSRTVAASEEQTSSGAYFLNPRFAAHRVGRAALAIGAAVVGLWATLRVGWMSDDGLINIRTALNVSVGNGPVFNAGERVQAYTSPLWFWLEYAVGKVTGEFIISAILLGAALTTAALVVLVLQAVSWQRALLVLLAFVLSSTLVDWATGGLENGLAMLLVALFCTLASVSPFTPLRAAALGLIAACVVLTRLDLIILVGPLAGWIAYQCWRTGRRVGMALLATFVIPVLMWHVWSHEYYGSWLPNTYYAKLNVAIPRNELLMSGLRFIVVSLEADPAVVVLFGGALFFAAVSKSPRHVLAMIGALAYVAYVVWVGGDFMAGRFLTGPLVAALWVLSSAPTGITSGSIHESDSLRGPALVLVVALSAIAFQPMIVDRPAYDSPERWMYANRGGIADEAGYYRQRNSSLLSIIFDTQGRVTFQNSSGSPLETPPLWRLRRLEDLWSRYRPPPTGIERPVSVWCGGIGGASLRAGPKLHLIDGCALTDPLLARIRWSPKGTYEWRVGHYVREIPAGYEDAVRFASPRLVRDRQIRAKLRRIWQRVRR